MKPFGVVCLLAFASLPIRSSALFAQQPVVNQPGMSTVARMYVLNRGTEEAVPVVVQSGGEIQPVAVMSAPALTLAPDATVSARPARIAWEYRHLVLTAGEDVAAALNKAGMEGWEAVSGMAATGGRVQVILKRPR